MNEVFIMAKIITNIEFEFLINSKKVTRIMFKVMIENATIINIKGYDKIADYCYRNLNKGNYIFINGYINTDMEIVIKKISKL